MSAAMGSLTVYPDGPDAPGLTFTTANGFVSRVVSAVADANTVDALRVCAILNAHFQNGGDVDGLLPGDPADGKITP
jgi:hypothetical protein